MSFPTNPTNGQTVTINNVTYVYNSTLTAWNKQGAVADASPVASVAGRTGVITLTAADINAGQFPQAISTNSTLLTQGNIVANAGSPAVSTTTGAIVVRGGIGVSGDIVLGGTLSAPSINGTIIGNVTTANAAFANTQISSLGIGTAASGTAGEIRATNAITAYYSDRRLKTNFKPIENALDKLEQITGLLYTQNDLAAQFGYNNYEQQVGVIAQDVLAVQPEAVKPAPFDIDETGNSRSGEHYLTVQYDRLIPLIIESIKELRQQVNSLKGD